jgi:glycosyltransferase involved in cell wall biosynthesis
MWGTGCTGGNRVLFGFMNELTKLGHDVTCISLADQAEWAKFKFPLIYVPRYTNDTDCALSLSRSIPNADITISTYCFTAYSNMIGGKGKKVHHLQHLESLFFEPKTDWVRFYLAEHLHFLDLDFIINSSWLKKTLGEHFDVGGHFLTPAIDHDIFYPRDVDKERRVVALGKGADINGLRFLLEANKEAKKTHNIEFVLFGGEQQLASVDVVDKYITWPSDNNLAELYSSSSCLVMPSIFESFPLVPLEAMACGTQTIVTPNGTEDYTKDGKNCFVVPHSNSKALAEKIRCVLDNPDEKMIKEGIKESKKHNWDKVGKRCEMILERILNDENGNNR